MKNIDQNPTFLCITFHQFFLANERENEQIEPKFLALTPPCSQAKF